MRARVVAQAQQHFHRRALLLAAMRRHDRLAVQLEAVVAQRCLQRLQPVDLAALARDHLVARRVHGDVPALLLGDIAGRIGRGQQLLHVPLSRDSSTRPMLTPMLKMRSFHTKR